MDVVDSIVQYMITSTRQFEAKAEEEQKKRRTGKKRAEV